jgi:hypothetical protein
MAMLGLNIPRPDNLSITSYTDYLLSDTGEDEMDRFGEDFFSIST